MSEVFYQGVFMKHAKPPMHKVLASFIRFLKARKLSYDNDPERGLLRAGLEGENCRWRYGVFEDANRFIMVSWIPIKAPESRRGACAELLARINTIVSIGHFGLDVSDGEISFRTVVPVPVNTRLHASVIEDVVGGHHQLVDEFLPAITSVLFAGLAPETAIATKVGNPQPPAATPAPRFSLN